MAFGARPGGRLAVVVHQTVRTPADDLVAEGDVVHVYGFAGDRVSRMDVEEPPAAA